MARFPLLHEESRDLWQRWFASAGSEAIVPRGIVYTDSGLVLQAALQGEGVALMDELFAKNYLSNGTLVQPFELPIAHGAYGLVARTFSGLPEEATKFVVWLESRLKSA